MKLSQIFTLLFLASLVLFIPLSSTEQQYTLITGSSKTIIINVQNTNLIISGNRATPFEITLSYLNAEKDIAETIQEKQEFIGEKSFPIDQRGFYRIDLSSDFIITITITTEGIPDTTIFIVSLTFLLAIVTQVQKQFSTSFDY